ncbi:MAG: efflux transporter periplasmic adaptor subunit [Gallionellales bacterium RIFCSPLOWO2_02_FULL_57_47]|nr:MAG: efflux transporter periplasmic adaptor subunit [Gallionellales bacterium RIFCSPLOWO2_02_FULL_57_47]OGT13330.1 MAG: efflux transporter periplasmic adaptor subunit [Gallionellales bacterium RIFCSPHIGHO2_02_FULL_57_16]
MTFSQHRGQPPLLKYFSYFAVMILLGVAAWYFTRPAPLFVQMARAEHGMVEATVNNTRAGTVKACRRAKLAPPSGGQISRLLVRKGQRVKANQVLLELWNDDLQAQEWLAREQLATAQTQEQQACVQADLAEKEADRARQLRERGFISAEAVDQRISAAKVSRAGCEVARSQVDQSRSRIAVARASLERMVLRAPFDGIVADISGELGEYATPSPPGILTLPAIDLIDDRCMFVSAPIDEADAANIKVGQVARITLDAIKGKSFAGKVKRIAPYVLELEKQARTVEVEVEFVEAPNDENLLVGYSADVEIVYDSRANVLRIPTQTLLEGKRVLLYGADGVLEEHTVTTGLANWEQTEITTGLNEGDQIVMSLDRAGVKAGVRVQPEVGKPVK